MITPKQSYEASVAKGFYNPVPSQAQRLVLIIGELSEAVEAIRADSWFDNTNKSFVSENGNFIAANYKQVVKGTVDEEIADTYIRVLDYIGYKGYSEVELPEMRLPEDLMEAILVIMSVATTAWTTDSVQEEVTLNAILALLEQFSEQHNIDLEFHVEQKFLYNQSRPFKHGKAF